MGWLTVRQVLLRIQLSAAAHFRYSFYCKVKCSLNHFLWVGLAQKKKSENDLGELFSTLTNILSTHFNRGTILIYFAFLSDIRNGRPNQAKCRCYLGSGEWTTRNFVPTNLDKLKPAALRKTRKSHH